MPGEAEIEPPAVVEPSEIAEPPCELYVTVNVAAIVVVVFGKVAGIVVVVVGEVVEVVGVVVVVVVELVLIGNAMLDVGLTGRVAEV